MVTGYSLPSPADFEEYESFASAFEWRIPDTYSIAEAAFETGNEDDAALYHVCEDGSSHVFTYAELDRSSDRLAATMRTDGISAGDRIVSCFPQCPEALVLHLAAFKLGAVTVPASFVLGTDSFEHTVESSGASSVWLDTVAADRFRDAVAKIDDELIHVVELSGDRYASAHADRPLGGLRPYTGSGTVDATAEVRPDDPAMILYTSGTSSEPKGVVQAHQYLIGTLPGYQLWFHLFGERHDERVWTPAAWAWAGALFDAVFPTLAMGGTVCSRIRRTGFDAVTALEFIDRAQISRLFLPATALRQILDETEPSSHGLETLSVVLSGGEYLSAEHRDWAERALDATVNVSYGTTEANALIGNCRELFPPREDSIGFPYPGHNVTVVDESGDPVEPGVTGEIGLSAPDPVLFEGYWKDEAATASSFTGEDLFLTGDLGYYDADGYVYYAGRKDEVILSSGYRVSPKEVEETLESSPAVLDAVVVGVDDPDVGTRIAAYIILNGHVEESLDELELEQYVRDRLGMHKAPHELIELEDPPTTHSGKINRAKLLSQLERR